MAVLIYQIGIFLAINISAKFGKSSRNTATLLISIFTILQVFVSWLLLLQFFTILVAYIFSNFFLPENNQEKRNEERKNKTVGYGLSQENPILLKSNKSSYIVINELRNFSENLSYNRKAYLNVKGFEENVEKYEFRKNDDFFCNVYIYPFANEDMFKIPKPFKKL
jgi:hypothetical protein